MIEARFDSAFAALARRLTARARTLAEARAADRLLARRDAAGRWRKARLLWPLFVKG